MMDNKALTVPVIHDWYNATCVHRTLLGPVSIVKCGYLQPYESLECMTIWRWTSNNKLKALQMTTKSQFIIAVLIFGCNLIWPKTSSLLLFFSILARNSSPWLYIFFNKTLLGMFSSTTSLFFFFLLTHLSGSSIFHLATHLANHFSYKFFVTNSL